MTDDAGRSGEWAGVSAKPRFFHLPFREMVLPRDALARLAMK
jgi:hypothetical protein